MNGADGRHLAIGEENRRCVGVLFQPRHLPAPIVLNPAVHHITLARIADRPGEEFGHRQAAVTLIKLEPRIHRTGNGGGFRPAACD